MFCCLYANQLRTIPISKHFRILTTTTGLGLLEPLFSQKFLFFETIKAAIHWHQTKLNQHACRNVSDTLLHAFLAFSSILKYSNCTKSHSLLPDLVLTRWTNSKGSCIYTASVPQRLWILIPKAKVT